MEAAAGYRAATESAAVFDDSSRGKIAVAGSDRRSYLHAMLTNDVASLEAGSGCYAAYLTPQGRMIADMRVLELGDLVLLDLDAGVSHAVLQRLDQFVFSEDVQLGDLGAAFGKLIVAGPAAAACVAAVLHSAGGPAEPELSTWAEFRNARASFHGQMVLIAASRELGVRDSISTSSGRTWMISERRCWRLVRRPETGRRPMLLRLEAGRPTFGADMDADTIPLEAGIEERAISFTKGCYPGQEVVIRVLHRGQGRIARKIAGVRVPGDTAPSRGDVVRSGEREAGRVTSAAWSPRANGVIALAMLHRDFLSPGTELVVQHGEQALPATVVELPFVATP